MSDLERFEELLDVELRPWQRAILRRLGRRRRLHVIRTLDLVAAQMAAEGYPLEAIEKIREAQDIIDPNQGGGA